MTQEPDLKTENLSVPRLTPEELQRQRARSKALGLLLAGLAILFFIVTIAKMGGAVFDRTL